MESLSIPMASLVANRLEGDYIAGSGRDVAGYRDKREAT